MNIIKDKLRQTVAELLAQGAEFMVYRLPGRTPKLVCAAKPRVDVRIALWNQSFDEAVTLKDASAPDFNLPDSTPKEKYLSDVAQLISRLQERGMSKTVYSRIIAGANPGLDWIDIADRLWQHFPDCFGYLFYTAQTGAWLGATPEKLVFTFAPSSFTTCALAGTLPVDEPWNRKNYDEQQMVVDFIRATLRKLKLDFEESGTRTLQYGRLKHLITNFRGEMTAPERQAIELLDNLSPTPALSGWPREAAISDIEQLESHQRGCYGGYIYIKDELRTYSFVTIRCVQFEPLTGRWAVYVGGGITPASRPEDEWNETALKAEVILQLINGRSIAQ